ncbi:MAG: alpha/beta-type small acid-soluble spore protein [Actinomycetia bacterium]|nr:alpha/beta-type small acid-soluble spore protein [Actinomycetes bacterium]
MDDAERGAGRARRRLRRLKYEVARDLGLDDDIARRGWGNMTTREVGRIGGQMVRRLVRRGKRALAEEAAGD